MIPRKFGWRPSLPSRAPKYKLHNEMLSSPPMPPVMDLSLLCSPIEDQGQLGSCVAHGTCGALEFVEMQDIRKKTQNAENFGSSFDPLSRLYVYANARMLDGTPLFQDVGTSPASAIRSIKSMGICRESLWPYADQLAAIKPGPKAYAEGAAHKVLFEYQVDNTELQQLKQCLAWGYPIIYGQVCYSSMMTQAVESSGYIPMPSESDMVVGGHCMLIVGYDDINKKFKIRNSWGLSFGQKGYGTIDYAYLTDPSLASDFWTIRTS